MQNKALSRIYYPEIDRLRFIAFLLVFINHAPYILTNKAWATLHEFGWIGVDVFLCLSSFLITKLLLEEIKIHKTIDIKKFYIRRALKIWPLYYFFVAFALLSSYQIQTTDISWQRLLGLATFTDNIVSVVQQDYNHLFASVHLWTISFEEQIYIFLPFMVLYLFRQKSRKQVFFIGLLFLGGGLLRSLFIHLNFKHPSIWVFPPTHFESVLAGLVIGLNHNHATPSNFKGVVYLLCAIFLFFISTKLPNIENVTYNLMISYPVIGAGAGFTLVSALHLKIKSIENMGVLNRLFIYLGKISYGLYVYHILALIFTDYLINNFMKINDYHYYVYIMMICGLFITILISTISYHVIEKPFLKLKDKFSIIKSRPI